MKTKIAMGIQAIPNRRGSTITKMMQIATMAKDPTNIQST